MSLITVVIPAYNAATTLPATVQSLIGQTWTDWQAIIVEDGSQDDTLAVAQALAAGEPRLSVVRNPGKGPSDARNHAAMDLATGVFLAFCDADDIWLPGKLASVVTSLLMGEADAVFGRIGFFESDPARVGARSTVPETRVTVPMLMGENPVCTMSNLSVRTDVFRALGGFRAEMVHNEDLEWLIRLVGSGYELWGLHEDHIRYRTSTGGLSADLAAMMRGRAQALETARRFGFAPDDRAEAIHLRYLARRALRVGCEPRLALRLALSGLRRDARGFLFPLHRGAATALAAMLAPALPAPLRHSLFSK
ncbi:glycosyltransferase family 2 protein [Salipiger bermudensis]|uniref:glycosyltransferase family 2 protein n=1 Tax=Salipiger bermudensis TaxID=344736 RepID=UPI001C996FD9|nr:glycosyltransferase family A protein [Salipiger bermudensis]MBY6004025.1 glycosyltransferase family 2 protein [Salipiger bermudensis]